MIKTNNLDDKRCKRLHPRKILDDRKFLAKAVRKIITSRVRNACMIYFKRTIKCTILELRTLVL